MYMTPKRTNGDDAGKIGRKEVHGGYSADLLKQKGESSDWEDVIRSLDLTNHQREAAIIIIRFVAEKGEPNEYNALSIHANRREWWPTRFVTRRQMREATADVQKLGICSARYGWYMVHWLIRNGWLDSVDSNVPGFRAKGYTLSRRIGQYHLHALTAIPKLWALGGKKSGRTKRGAS